MSTDRILVGLAPWLTIGVLVVPVLAGLADIFGPAFGVMTASGQVHFTLEHFGRAFAEPGFATSVWLGFWIGPATALIALTLVTGFVAAWSGTRSFHAVVALLRPVLAVPHAATAFGLALLFMPSGFLMRLVSPELTGFERPPDWLIINDPAGIALLIGLVLKEMPFLLLVLLAALPQADESRLHVAVSAGYGRIWGWLIAVFPSVYAQIRLPVYAVIVFAGSVVDMALILGPGTPPTLAIRILRWMNDPDLAQRLTASAAAIMQLGVTGVALALWWGVERIVAKLGRAIALHGVRLRRDAGFRILTLVTTGAAAFWVLAGIGLLGLFSVSGIWRFPDTLPSAYTFSAWQSQAPELAELALNAVIIGVVSSLVALVLVLGCLENEYRRQKPLSKRARLILYLPLLVPQISFLPGLTVLFLSLGVDGNLTSVVFVHLVFVLPYIYLVLADPWNAFDVRYLDVARALGKGRMDAFLTIRLPILLRPILTAFALGFAISVAQYLPTLLVGGGRVPTITTEAIALGSGGNRRLIGVYGVMQTLLPFAMFTIAAMIPAIVWRNRRALRPGAIK